MFIGISFLRLNQNQKALFWLLLTIIQMDFSYLSLSFPPPQKDWPPQPHSLDALFILTENQDPPSRALSVYLLL